MTRFTPSRLTSALVLVGAVSLLLGGCARPVGTVTGKVTYQGKPLKGGNVSFHSTEGRPSFASGIAEDGTYKVPDIQGGSYKVCVETASLKPSQGAPMMGPKVSGPPPDAKTGAPPKDADIPEGYKPSAPAAGQTAANLKKYVAIPDKYAKPDQTDLTYEFKGGSDTVNIDLK